jgi:hypothetical protein
MMKELLAAMRDYYLTKRKKPTHLYVNSRTLGLLVEPLAWNTTGGTFLGLKIVFCDPMPDERDWFVTA